MSKLIIFTTAPTGLGHIRVMNALIDGLSSDIKYKEIGVININASKIHALGSRFPFLTKITEFYQTNPILESIATFLLRLNWQAKSKELVKQLSEIEKESKDISTWVFVSTHFALATTTAKAKNIIEKTFSKKVILCVVMTDDSAQKVWAVKGADIIFVPSNLVAKKISSFLGQKSKTKVVTVSFPVSPNFTGKSSNDVFNRIEQQLNPAGKLSTHIEIPISGAAVQLDFFQKLISNLSNKNFLFTVVGQESPFTHFFFDKLRKFPHVQLSIGQTVRQTVDYYESLFSQNNKPSIEITKPSEQVFKAILEPTEIGGVILLLTSPIGRQEKDNLKFLIRHDLAPNDETQKELETEILNFNAKTFNYSQWLYRASHWRAIRLPNDPLKASIFIQKIKEIGILYSMLSYLPEGRQELTSNGVSQIWEEIDKVMKYNRS